MLRQICCFWHTGTHYLRLGVAVLNLAPWLYCGVLAFFSIPAAMAAALSISGLPEGVLRSALLWSLNAISASVAPPVIMVLIAAGYHGKVPRLTGAVTAGLRWLPRYLWTNIHTSIIFWIPVSSLLWLYGWQRDTFPLNGLADLILTIVWTVVIVLVALYMHTRTLLAPFLAIHGNLPGTLATLEAWRLSGRYFTCLFGSFIISSAPAFIPLAIATIACYLVFARVPEQRAAMVTMWPSLIWVLIKFVRPFLIAAVYGLYHDLSADPGNNFHKETVVPIPSMLVPIVAISAFLPRMFGKLIGRRFDWIL